MAPNRPTQGDIKDTQHTSPKPILLPSLRLSTVTVSAPHRISHHRSYRRLIARIFLIRDSDVKDKARSMEANFNPAQERGAEVGRIGYLVGMGEVVELVMPEAEGGDIGEGGEVGGGCGAGTHGFWWETEAGGVGRLVYTFIIVLKTCASALLAARLNVIALLMGMAKWARQLRKSRKKPRPIAGLYIRQLEIIY